MNIRQAADLVTVLRVSPELKAAAEKIAALLRCPHVETGSGGGDIQRGEWRITVNRQKAEAGAALTIRANGSALITVTHRSYAYSFLNFILNDIWGKDIRTFARGRFFSPSFQWLRSSYDNFLCQEWRVHGGLEKASYIQSMAAAGFTHLEVNGLGWPMALEDGPQGETYLMFYTYCPALDQFVSSSLASGLSPDYYLSANLANL